MDLLYVLLAKQLGKKLFGVFSLSLSDSLGTGKDNP